MEEQQSIEAHLGAISKLVAVVDDGEMMESSGCHFDCGILLGLTTRAHLEPRMPLLASMVFLYTSVA